MSKQHQARIGAAQAPALSPIRGGLIQRQLLSSSVSLAATRQDSAQIALQHEAENHNTSSSVDSAGVQDALRLSGEPLDQNTRGFMEPRFGHDFSKVRVHRDEKAAASAHSLSALAYTVGNDVVFGSGQYSPDTSEGRKVLAHELAHTIQQGSTVQRLPEKFEPTSPNDSAEREADAAADFVVEGRAFSGSDGHDAQLGKEGPTANPEETSPAEEAAPAELEGKDTPKKTVTVNVTFLKDGSTDIATHLTKANTVFAQANVEVKKGKEETLDETKSKAILGDDLILDEFSDPKTPTTEEKALVKENRTAGTITMYYVKSMSKGSIGEAFFPSTGVAESFVYASSNTRTWPHELGHVLLDAGEHPADADNFMAQTSVATGKEKMTPEQITKIQSSAFVK
jgi:uncharacterized protein DUF4157